MFYKETAKKYERVYEVLYNDNELSDLLESIITNTSYQIKGRFVEASVKTKKELNLFDISNPGYMYKDIKNCQVNSAYDELGSRCQVLDFNATKICPPHLASIIDSILKGEEKAIPNLLKYGNDEELVPIDVKILALNDKINNIDNMNCDMKISALEDMKRLIKEKKEHQYYEPELLKQYYMKALSIIELNMISEKLMVDGPKVLLKNYISKKGE